MFTQILITASVLTFGFVGDIKKDDEVIFFRTYGRQVEDAKPWEIQLRAWVYDRDWKEKYILKFGEKMGVHASELDGSSKPIFNDRARYFLVDDKDGRDVAIRFGGRNIPMGKSDKRGHSTSYTRLFKDEIDKQAEAIYGDIRKMTVHAVLRSDDVRAIAGEILLIPDEGLSVLSDIDDTLKVTEVRDRVELVKNTFLRPFKAVPSMAEVYGAWRNDRGAAFHYVSASPWQLYPSLQKFLDEERFPIGSIHLQDFDWEAETIFKMIASPERFKKGVIEPILRHFPKRKFILVGDSGEKDPEVYGDLARRFPDQVIHVMIRNVSDEVRESDRMKEAFKDVPEEKWRLFTDPTSLIDAVQK